MAKSATPGIASPRTASPRHIASLSRTLSRAFFDDPVTTWLFPDDTTRRQKAGKMFAALMRTTIRHGVIWTTKALKGAALWQYLDRGPASWIRQLPAGLWMIPLLGQRVFTALPALTRVSAAHPNRPHYYLLALGIDPLHQRCGVGSRLMEPTLARCDAEQMPAYLEASSQANVPFYERHGFKVTEVLQLNRGPTIYSMQRSPRP